MEKADTLLVSKSNSVLIVGRKMSNQTTKVVNAFQGEEAERIYKMLLEKPAVSTDAKISE